MMKIKISIIIPTYNESEVILIFLEKLIKVLQKLKDRFQTEIIIIDDNSPDLTAFIIKRKYKNNSLIKTYIRKKEIGLGTAIGFGIKKAKGDIIVGVDADGNHEIERIPFLLNKLKSCDLVVASRFIKGGGVESIFDKIRHLGSFSLNLFLKIFLGFPVWDCTSGYYAIRKEKLEDLDIDKIYYGYGDYHLRLVYFAKLKKYKIKEIPYVYQKRIGGKSKSKLIYMFFSYLKEAIRLSFF